MVASDGQTYWATPALPNSHACAIEYIVGKAGQLIGAPVVDVTLLDVPLDLDGVSFFGIQLDEGPLVAAREVPSAFEGRPVLQYRLEDDNARRHVGAIALYDWCLGSDGQWLYQTNAAYSTFSHDHSHYLGGPVLDGTRLRKAADTDRLPDLRVVRQNLSGAELLRIRDRLRAVEVSEVRGLVDSLPLELGGVSQPLRKVIVEVLMHRRMAVANRLDALR